MEDIRKIFFLMEQFSYTKYEKVNFVIFFL